jgi:hypothetical protein
MINIAELSPSDMGRWVKYIPTGEVGKLKAWSQQSIWVVYYCDGNWDEYARYTALLTKPEQLEWAHT